MDHVTLRPVLRVFGVRGPSRRVRRATAIAIHFTTVVFINNVILKLREASSTSAIGLVIFYGSPPLRPRLHSHLDLRLSPGTKLTRKSAPGHFGFENLQITSFCRLAVLYPAAKTADTAPRQQGSPVRRRLMRSMSPVLGKMPEPHSRRAGVWSRDGTLKSEPAPQSTSASRRLRPHSRTRDGESPLPWRNHDRSAACSLPPSHSSRVTRPDVD
ncbi:uncharacterized protein CLUP02_15866 [Colletotrichum lupini]|uniref:Uncharacterized protein n=1 Tax=Colletotrichum lupini TaxID=145971 RepID=A0A9Q8WP46_9PEZI|nr:uncharacterized protein CLUP02_15866 [Colletotrichum lupini]UQC90336.1 hypothetical protein CLUP02_15866 [Colletotrichum lupini]